MTSEGKGAATGTSTNTTPPSANIVDGRHVRGCLPLPSLSPTKPDQRPHTTVPALQLSVLRLTSAKIIYSSVEMVGWQINIYLKMYVACRARHRLSVMHVCSAATTEHVVDILAPKVIVQANVATFFFFFFTIYECDDGKKV